MNIDRQTLGEVRKHFGLPRNALVSKDLHDAANMVYGDTPDFADAFATVERLARRLAI